jgi:hypothetical protein
VIARAPGDGDPGLGEPVERGAKALGRGLRQQGIVERVARDQHGVDLFLQREFDRALERCEERGAYLCADRRRPATDDGV